MGSNPTPSAKIRLNHLILLYRSFLRTTKRTNHLERYGQHWAGRFRAGGRNYFRRRLVLTVQEVPAGMTH